MTGGTETYHWFQLSEYSIGNLTTTLLLLVITTYLLLLRRKNTDTWLVSGYIAVLALLLISYVFRYSVLDPRAVWTGQLSNLIVFGVWALVAFAYYYQETRIRERSGS